MKAATMEPPGRHKMLGGKEHVLCSEFWADEAHERRYKTKMRAPGGIFAYVLVLSLGWEGKQKKCFVVLAREGPDGTMSLSS